MVRKCQFFNSSLTTFLLFSGRLTWAWKVKVDGENILQLVTFLSIMAHDLNSSHIFYTHLPFGYFLLKNILLYYFPLPFSPLRPLTLITTLPPVSTNSFFLFACSPSPPNLLPHSGHLLSIYESVPIFLVTSVCSLDSTYE